MYQPPFAGSGGSTTISVPLGTVASYLIHTDARLHIPMMHGTLKGTQTPQAARLAPGGWA